MALRLYNTMSRTFEEFRPLENEHVRMYTCGPTVYAPSHVGNFRAYIFEDILRRYLKYRGYGVTQVMNLTDIDDKTIRDSQAAGISLDEHTRKFKDMFFEDLDRLNIERAELYPEAAKHIPEQFRLKYSQIPWSQMAGMRDKLIHEYFGIKLDVLWQTIFKRFPEIKQPLQKLLTELDTEY